MENIEELDLIFDELLHQIIRGKVTHENLEKGIRYEEFQQVSEWESRYGYKFSIYPNDHLIDGKMHFHFDNKEANVHCKLDFEGNVLVKKGKSIPSRILKELRYFLSKESTKQNLVAFWLRLNPNVKPDKIELVKEKFEQIPTTRTHNGLPVYEIIDGEITAISLVDKPAHGFNFKIIDEEA
jgi:hypothetical protein